MTSDFDAYLGEFCLEATERIDRVESLLLLLEGDPADAENRLVELKRDLHTLKGNAGMMGLDAIQGIAHHMEDEVAAAQRAGTLDPPSLLSRLDEIRAAVVALDPAASTGGDAPSETATSARIPFASLDALVDLVGETVLARNRLTDALTRAGQLGGRRRGRRGAARSDVHETFDDLCTTLDFMQDRVMSLRMVPLQSLLGSLRRLVHDEAERAGKTVELHTEGGETPFDKALLELANEALGHLVRNAVVHGIEKPAARAKAGKPASGLVTVVAASRGSEVEIEVRDDGAGVDGEAIRAAAQRRGIDTSDVNDAHDLLFTPGFSTQSAADRSAGRGVGLAAVLEAVRRQGGAITVTSDVGRGTTFRLVLPLNVSIARALLLEADGERYAIPLRTVKESRRLRREDRHRVNHAGVIEWREELVTLVDLGVHFGTATDLRDAGYAIVIEAAAKRRALLVDHIRGIHEIVVKGLDPVVGQPPGIAGSTVMGDGDAVLILDPRELVEVEPFVARSA